MILKKPYAILIKYFKFIHVILTILMGYLFYKTNLIMSFINEYLSSTQTTIKSDVVSVLFGPIFIIVIAFIILGTLVIMSLMLFKKKPINLYIYNIITYIFSAVIFVISYSVIKKLEIGLVDIRTLKMVQDLITLSIMLQSLSMVIVVIRATGFNIKKFNFVADLEELDIEINDNEEFELDLAINTDDAKRLFRKRLRYSKYVYLENKLFINMIALLSIAIVFTFVYLNLGVYNKIYKQSEAFKSTEFIFNIKDSYLSDYDYKGSTITKGKEYIVIKINIKKLSLLDKVLNTGRFTLMVDNNNYYHNANFKDKFVDLGSTYSEQNINDYFNSYLLVFEIPKNLNKNKIFLRYNDLNNKNIKVKVNPIDLSKVKTNNTTNLNETMNFKNSILEESNLIIESYEISDTFKLNYEYCVKEECFDSYEYLKVSTTDNYEKTLLKLTGSLIIDDSLENINLDIAKLIKNSGSIKYKINGVEKTLILEFNEVKSKKVVEKNNYYIEVSNVLKEAEAIELVFNIRNSIYTYKLR